MLYEMFRKGVSAGLKTPEEFEAHVARLRSYGYKEADDYTLREVEPIEVLAARLEGMTPSEVDQEWAERALPTVHEALRERAMAVREYKRYRKAYGEDAVKVGGPRGYVGEKVERAAAKVEEAQKRSEPYTAEWKRRGCWDRFFLSVGSANGHVHRPHCYTLTPGVSLISPVYEVSGFTEEEVVATLQYTACTHCFRSAPVATVRGPEMTGHCPGSGKPLGKVTGRRYDRRAGYELGYGSCSEPGCRWRGSETTYGVARKHKKEEAA